MAQKWYNNDPESGIVSRDYLVKCPGCKTPIMITDEHYTCPTCGLVICPDCLKPLHTTTDSGGNSNGNWLRVSCSNCDYTFIDY
jgi:ribosomal protein S27E